MLSVLVHRDRHVLLARLSGSLTLGLLTTLARLGVAYGERLGDAMIIVDFSGVSNVDVSTADVAARARTRPIMPLSRRIYACPTYELYGLARLFLTHREIAGHVQPRLTRTLEEALDLVGVSLNDFEPLSLDEIAKSIIL